MIPIRLDERIKLKVVHSGIESLVIKGFPDDIFPMAFDYLRKLERAGEHSARIEITR